MKRGCSAAYDWNADGTRLKGGSEQGRRKGNCGCKKTNKPSATLLADCWFEMERQLFRKMFAFRSGICTEGELKKKKGIAGSIPGKPNLMIAKCVP